VQKTSNLKRLAARFLATTCLTVAGGAVAMAGPYSGPYGSTFGTATNVGLDTPVTGAVTLTGNVNDWFEFEGLPGLVTLGSIFTVQDVSGSALGLTIEDDLGNVIMGPTGVASGTTATLSGNVPVDGNVVFHIAPTNESPANFSVTLTNTPEPGTMAAIGLGLTGLAAAGLRRRKKN
jgi:hypothetical protein